MTCDIQPCAKPGELACTLGGTSRRVLCVDHQVRLRTAATMGGRAVVVHHGVDLSTWRASEPVPVDDVPYLGLPHETPMSYPLDSIDTPTVADSSQYQRGRADERAAVAEYLRRWEPGLSKAIARGDHLEGK